ncbi:MAG: nuclear transport factor 2 family protein [Pseudomonadota bacterium]
MHASIIHRTTLALVLLVTTTCVQADSEDDLSHAVRSADARFFQAFNLCDLTTMGEMFSRSLEFYHDLSGLSGYEETLTVTRENCARKLGLVRTLVPGSDRVFPIKGFGAIHLGEHTFCHEADGQEDCGTFGFTHVWQRTSHGWQISRVVSYGH